MNSSDSSWVWFCEEPDAATVSTWMASWPVRWIWSPAGARGSERRADGVHDAFGLGARAERDDRRFHERLPCLAVTRDAEVDHGLHVIDTPDLRFERIRRGVVGGGQPTVARHDERGRRERDILEGRRHHGRLHARGIRRKEAARGVLGHVAQRREEPDGEHGHHDPDQYDQEPEAHRESPEASEETAHSDPFMNCGLRGA